MPYLHCRKHRVKIIILAVYSNKMVSMASVMDGLYAAA
jgi:hypothetical protein